MSVSYKIRAFDVGTTIVLFIAFITMLTFWSASLLGMHAGFTHVATPRDSRVVFSDTVTSGDSNEVGVDLEDYSHSHIPEMNRNDEVDLARDTESAPSSLATTLEKQRVTYELKRLGNAFNNIEGLFSRVIVKAQKISADGRLGPESLSNLKAFLEGTHDLSTIASIIDHATGLKLNERRLRYLTNDQSPSLTAVVRVLLKHRVITEVVARQLVVNNSILTSKELMILIENGAAKTYSGYMVQLRTGGKFGDVLGLINEVMSALNNIEKSKDSVLCKKSVTDLLCETPMPELIKAFENAGLDSEKTISDAWVIQELQKHFLFVGSLLIHTKFRDIQPGFNPRSPGGAASLDRSSYMNWQVVPFSTAILLVSNYYFDRIDADLNNGVIAHPFGLAYFGSLSFLDHGPNWWMVFTDGFLGGGINYTVNFDKGAFWANGQPTFLTLGVIGAGWRDSLSGGITLQTMLANNVALGAYAYVSMSRSHDVLYQGEYPIDGKFASIRGLKKIEIIDNIDRSHNGLLAANFTALSVPLGVAFRASVSHTKARIFRTHVPMKTIEKIMPGESVPGVLYVLGKKIKATGIPTFLEPEKLIDGDELLETKIGKLSGAFLFGIDTAVQLAATRVGGSIELTAEFALGLKRLPANKFEVSIEPKRVIEASMLAGALNLLGAGRIKNLALARKQIFFFDFDHPDAKKAYFDLILDGRLPTSEEVKVFRGDGGPEYLIAEFRAQNEIIKSKGVARTFLESMYIDSLQTYYGIRSQLASGIFKVINRLDKEARKSKERINLQLEGIDRAFFHSDAESIATNGLIAVRRSTSGGRRSLGQGLSGRYNEDLFITHRRIHTIDDSDPNFVGNKWQFDSLVVHSQLEDTVITGDEENKIAEKINRLFSTMIGTFNYRNSKTIRKVNLEREISKNDIFELTQPEIFDRVNSASEITGIERAKIYEFLAELRNKHIDLQGHLIKKFIEDSHGITGFAAIHQLLGAKPERLYIVTESGYQEAIMRSRRLIARYGKSSEENGTTTVKLSPVKSDKKTIRKFFAKAKFHLNDLDKQLRLLADDQYLLDDHTEIAAIYSPEKVQKLINAGIRQNKSMIKNALVEARKNVLELIDLKAQGFSPDQRMLIYELAHSDDLPLEARIELLLRSYENQPIAAHMSKEYLRARFSKSWALRKESLARIKSLKNDDVMKAMDHDYVLKTISLLEKLKRRLSRVIAMDHLSREDLQEVKNKFDKEEKFGFSQLHKKKLQEAVIRGALSNLGSDANEDNEAEIDFEDSVEDQRT